MSLLKLFPILTLNLATSTPFLTREFRSPLYPVGQFAALVVCTRVWGQKRKLVKTTICARRIVCLRGQVWPRLIVHVGGHLAFGHVMDLSPHSSPPNRKAPALVRPEIRDTGQKESKRKCCYRWIRCLAVVVAVCSIMGFDLSVSAQAINSPFESGWSSTGSDDTHSIAWGDIDNDGDLDLALGNDGANRVYCNTDTQFSSCWESAETEKTLSVAWGDVDNDGDLDLAVGNMDAPNRIYRNDGGLLQSTSTWSSAESDLTVSVAWGDVDDDGDLDLAVGNGGLGSQQVNRLYLNNGGLLSESADWSSLEAEQTMDIAWGDFDGTGGADLAVGNTSGEPDRVYCSIGQQLDPCWQSVPLLALDANSVAWADVNGDDQPDLAIGGGASNFVYCNTGANLTLCGGTFTGDTARSVDWGDYDSDGDPDLAVGNGGFPIGQRVEIYRNDGIVNDELKLTSIWTSPVDLDTRGIMWGDVDGDGDLDLAIGNRDGQPNQVFVNQHATLNNNAFWTSMESEISHGVAWGDVNGDSHIDLAVGSGVGSGQVNRVYVNDGTGLLTPIWESAEQERTFAVAWGDVDGDGDLELAAGNNSQPNRLYLNESGNLNPVSIWQSNESDSTTSLAWGDIEGDGDLDLIVGNSGQPNRLYLNLSGQLSTSSSWESAESDATNGIAWGDIDGDGDLDLLVGNGNGQPNRLYENVDGQLTPSSVWSSSESDMTLGITLGDVDGDGDLDLAVANALGQVNRLYENQNGTLAESASWTSIEADTSSSLAFGDADGDGDLDLLVGNNGQPDRLYRNERGVLQNQAVWSTSEPDFTLGVAWGDANNDGRLDLAVGNSIQNRLYMNRGSSQPLHQGHFDSVFLDLYANVTHSFSQPITTLAAADHYSTPAIRSDKTIAVSYTVSSGESKAWNIRGFYSADGGGSWISATPAEGSDTSAVSAGVEHQFIWDVANSGFFGNSDNVRLRLEAVPVRLIPGQIPRATAQTFPFRLRGTQVQVLDNNGEPSPNARVYRLHAGHNRGGQLMGVDSTPFTTNSFGFLSGRGSLNIGDRLLALVPVSQTAKYTFYHTNLKPAKADLSPFVVSDPGLQAVAISALQPLLVFDLDISLEWDASADLAYQHELTQNLLKASNALYDWTNGQVSLGAISIYQDAQVWNEADIQLYASNQLRPIANRGGIVSTTKILTHPTLLAPLEHNAGQIRIGPTWNRYGEPEAISDDWPRVLAHEIGHYALFLEDTYLGQDEETGLLIPVDTCTGTAMTDPYDDIFSELRHDDQLWEAECGHTLAELPDWSLMNLAYPGLQIPADLNEGPAFSPFQLTTVSWLPAPPRSTQLLNDPNISLDETLRNGRAFLIRPEERLTDLGTAYLNFIIARGAREGDELCIFAQNFFSCDSLTNSTLPGLLPMPAWHPDIELTPINTTTIEILVAKAESNLLTATLYLNGATPQTATIVPGVATSISLTVPALEIWADIRGDQTGERIITSFTTGAGPGRTRSYGGPGRTRSYGGPIASGDSGLLIYPPPNLPDEGFIVVQLATEIPPVPNGLKAIGRGYQIRVSQHITDLRGGSLAFQYLGLDAVLAAGPQAEESMTVLFREKKSWKRLPTIVNNTQNFASAPLEAPGLYVLTAGNIAMSVEHVTPISGMANQSHQLSIIGNNFVQPLTVTLSGDTNSYPLTVVASSAQIITAVTPGELAPDLYDLAITAMNGRAVVLPEAFALYASQGDHTYFHDDFASGPGKWTIDGDWGIVQLTTGEEALTDSPDFPYRSARPGTTLSTTATSSSFTISTTGPVTLTLRHHGELTLQDSISVELSNDDGSSWHTIYKQTGQLGIVRAAHAGQEWESVDWSLLNMNLSKSGIDLPGRVLKLRLKLTVDDILSARGWVIDEISVSSRVPGHGLRRIYLPLLQ